MQLTIRTKSITGSPLCGEGVSLSRGGTGTDGIVKNWYIQSDGQTCVEVELYNTSGYSNYMRGLTSYFIIDDSGAYKSNLLPSATPNGDRVLQSTDRFKYPLVRADAVTYSNVIGGQPVFDTSAMRVMYNYGVYENPSWMHVSAS